MSNDRVFFLCCFLVFLACSDVKQEKVNLSEVRVQKGISHKIDFGNEPLYPKGCLLIDSLLVVYDSDLEENFIKMYDINSNKLVKETGRIGGGPCDFSEVRFLVEYRLSTPYRTFALGDTNNLYAVNVDSLLGGYKKCENRIVEKIPRQLLGYNYILQNNDSLIIANLTGENQLVFYDKKTGSVRGENYYVPNPKINLSKFNQTNNLYGACFASKSDTIAIAYNNLKQIDFVTSKGEIVKHVIFPNYDENIEKIKVIDDLNVKIENGKLYYTCVYPTNEFLYALCWDGNEKEVGQGKIFPSVHVFAWDGTLKEIIELDVPVSYFCVNKNKSLLFAIALNPDEFELELRKIELK